MAAALLIGSRLREHRLALGLRQGELAQKAAISPAYLNLIEHNRRKVTPDVLARLATALDLDPAEFDESSGDSLVAELREAAAALPEARAEDARVEEFSGRYPGWARLIAGYASHNAALRQSVMALNDRLSHDPGLSSALHELLTALSGVRSTAAILAETEDLSPDWQRRFHQNLHQDSERLVQGAESLVAWIDRPGAGAEGIATTPRDAFEAWLAARGYTLGEVAQDFAEARLEAQSLPKGAARALALEAITLAEADAAAMPGPAFAEAIAAEGGDPARIAARFQRPVIAVMRRMALRPGAEAGFVLCDASGTILFRKPLRGFALPRIGAACPLWPLFAALARPGQPFSQLVETPPPGAARFRCLSFCEASQPWGFAGPDLRHAAMLILPHNAPATDGFALPLGPTCRICPRDPCPARREESILAKG